MDLMTAFMAVPGVGPYLPYITLAMALCAAVAAALPAPGPDANPVWVAVYRLVNRIGMNVGRAKNADDAAAAKPAATSSTAPP